MKFRLASLIVLMIVVGLFAGWFKQSGRDPDVLVLSFVILAPLLLAVVSSFFQSSDPMAKTLGAYVFLGTLATSGLVVPAIAHALVIAFFAWPPQLILLHELHHHHSRKQEQASFDRNRRAAATRQNKSAENGVNSVDR